MPRKWRNHWDPVASAEMARNRDYKLATLGNFAIITQSLNTSISDGDWKTKKAGKKGNPGLDQCAAGLLTMADVLSEDSWDEAKIEARASWLYEKARTLWDSVLPAVDESVGLTSPNLGNGNRGEVRKQYWTYALPVIQKQNAHRGSFSNCNPTTSNWSSGYFGISGFSINCVANYDSARIDFWLGKADKAQNKAAFDILNSHKQEIENELGVSLTWDRADEYKASWLSYHLNGVSVTNENDWPSMAKFHAEWSAKICDAVLPYLRSEDDNAAKMSDVAGILREWAIAREGVNVNLAKCNRTYTRFTTDTMSKMIPDTPNEPSGWNTDNHYFYEIINHTGKSIYIKLAISAQNATKDLLEIFDRINECYPTKKEKDGWQWRTLFRTTAFDLSEDFSKEKVFSKLDKCLAEIQAFELEFKRKMNVEEAQQEVLL